MSITSVRLQKELEEMLDEAASRTQRSKNWLINQAVKEYLERNSREQECWQETLKALKSASEGKLIDADQVHEWLDSWGKDDELSPPKT